MIANGSQKEQYRNIEKGLLGALFGSLSFFACLAVILILLLGLHYLLFYYFKCRQVIYHEEPGLTMAQRRTQSVRNASSSNGNTSTRPRHTRTLNRKISVMPFV
ncbi:uncharacterized protein LOC142350819 [Convolutriloba macropyga]|uniref:uncharacterized protein LOC142350819 n=1 Tax=Convolutriloba macropyga TaxID=536237 RepID=UPI003F523320